MSPTKNEVNPEAQKTEKTIQYVAIVMALIVVVLVAWPYIKKLSPQKVDTGKPAAVQYNESPPMKIDQAKQYFATFKMAKGGEFVVELYPAKAPITVNSFVFLACKNFFDGLTFHRVIDGFMAQGGDPTGTGGGGPGYEFVNENSDLTFDKDGVVAM